MATRKPCPGCREVKPKRHADEVCGECRYKLKRFGELEKENEGLRHKSGLSECDFSKPFEARGATAELADAIFRAMRNMPKRGQRYLMPEAFDLWGLWRDVQEIARSEYKRGLRAGTNLLRRLNEGSLSMDDFLHRKERGI